MNARGILTLILLWVTAQCASASVPSGFTETQVVTGLSNPTAMAFANDGRIFVCQQGGAIRVVKNGTLLATPFHSLTVNSSGERGLLGIAFDPNFATNQFLYVYYTATTPNIHNRVSRFKANPADDSPYNAGQTISFSGSATDPEDSSVPASRFTWWVDFHDDQHTHPHVQPFSGSTTGSFSIPTTGETDDNQWYRLYLRVTDSGGLQNSTFVEIFPRKVTINLATNPAGLQLKLDGQTAPTSFTGIVGMSRNIEAVSPQTVGGNSYTFVSWSNGGARVQNITVPSSNTTYTATFTAGGTSGNGLLGTYFNNANFTGTTKTRLDSTINFSWGTGAPITGIAGNSFSVRWTGFVQPQYSQTYTFRTNTDDGVRLWVNGVRIINRWVNVAGISTGKITQVGGQKYAIKLEYYDDAATAKCILQWSSPSQALQVIPRARLYSQ